MAAHGGGLDQGQMPPMGFPERLSGLHALKPTAAFTPCKVLFPSKHLGSKLAIPLSAQGTNHSQRAYYCCNPSCVCHFEDGICCPDFTVDRPLGLATSHDTALCLDPAHSFCAGISPVGILPIL